MHFLVFYDQRGRCLRVAQANDRELQAFLDAGFIEVAQAEYERCAALVPQTQFRDLAETIIELTALGTVVSRATPRNVQSNRNMLLDGQREFNATISGLSRRVANGDISPDEWFQEFMGANRRVQLQAASASVGGRQNIGSQQIVVAEARLREQRRFALGFREQLQEIADSDVLVFNENAINARSQMYGQSSHATFEVGFQVGIGMPILPAQPGIRTDCLTNCKCRWIIRRLAGDGNFDCFWRLAPAEHCDTCLARARLFNPLQVRNGRILMPSGATSQIFA